MMFLMMMMMTLSLIFMLMTHPLSMGLILLVQTLIISMFTGNMNLNFWFSYIMFLIMIGGMLILFIYMTSIASNEKFHFKMKLMLLFLMMISIFSIIPTIFNYINYTNILNKEMLMLNNNNILNISINKYIYFPSNMIFMFMIIYLLITLIAVVKITNMSYGPLRMKN